MTAQNNPDDLENYLLGKLGQDWNSMVDRIKEEYKQSKSGSLMEAHINALIGAPPAIIANWILLEHFYPDDPTSQLIAIWAIVTWPIFFYLSVGRIWIIRRVFEKFGILLEPRYIYNWCKMRIKKWTLKNLSLNE